MGAPYDLYLSFDFMDITEEPLEHMMLNFFMETINTTTNSGKQTLWLCLIIYQDSKLGRKVKIYNIPNLSTSWR
jgi:hypothetical protein